MGLDPMCMIEGLEKQQWMAHYVTFMIFIAIHIKDHMGLTYGCLHYWLEVDSLEFVRWDHIPIITF